MREERGRGFREPHERRCERRVHRCQRERRERREGHEDHERADVDVEQQRGEREAVEVDDEQRQEHELHHGRDEHGRERETQSALNAPAFEPRRERVLEESVTVRRERDLTPPRAFAPVERFGEES